MSTQGTTPDIISSTLLAVWRMYPSKPEQVLRHLVDPPSPHNYRYLDAFAALCSLAPQCESASAAALKLGGESIHLYIATNPGPSAPHTLRNAMAKWIELVQQIPLVTASSSDSEAQTRVRNFIANVYRVCHAKLFDAVRYECDGKDLLEEVSIAPEKYLKLLRFDTTRRSSVVDSLKVLTSMAVGHDLEASSAEEILGLHGATRTAAKCKDNFPEMEFLHVAHRLSEAVDFIVAFAASERNQETIKRLTNVHWIDAPSPRDVIAAIDPKEFIEPTPDEEELYAQVFKKLAHHPKCMSQVEGSPGHVKATSVMHCESALLHYILHNNLPVGGVNTYIGTSQPACYACVMLVRAVNSASRKNLFALGRRCDTADGTWMMPEMGPKVYDELVSSLRKDFKLLAQKVHYDRTLWAGIVNDPGFLPEDVRRALELLPRPDTRADKQ